MGAARASSARKAGNAVTGPGAGNRGRPTAEKEEQKRQARNPQAKVREKTIGMGLRRTGPKQRSGPRNPQEMKGARQKRQRQRAEKGKKEKQRRPRRRPAGGRESQTNQKNKEKEQEDAGGQSKRVGVRTKAREA